jgi:hypothetical protein
MAMTVIARIARRVAGVVDEMNYAQRRSMELFLGLGETGVRHKEQFPAA